MKRLHQTVLLDVLLVVLVVASCKSSSKTQFSNSPESLISSPNDTVVIKSEKVAYEIVVIEPGFNSWLYSTAQPEGYYELDFLESRNRLLVLEWNIRVGLPNKYNPKIDYGYHLNFVLYNYFIYFQLKYNQRLTSFVPRI